MNLQSWLLYLHIVGAMVWIGGGATMALVGVHARRHRDRASLTAFARTLGYVGVRAFMPALAIVLVTGLALVVDGAGWRLTQAWLLIGLALFLVAFLVGAIYLSRVGIALERTVQSTGFDPRAVSELIGRWLAGYGLILVVLLAAVWDMVFRPLL